MTTVNNHDTQDGRKAQIFLLTTAGVAFFAFSPQLFHKNRWQPNLSLTISDTQLSPQVSLSRIFPYATYFGLLREMVSSTCILVWISQTSCSLIFLLKAEFQSSEQHKFIQKDSQEVKKKKFFLKDQSQIHEKHLLEYRNIQGLVKFKKAQWKINSSGNYRKYSEVTAAANGLIVAQHQDSTSKSKDAR